ncbi:MAG: PilT/PilU family type 4a pilus ATPase [Lachnospiraceae bacterium]|nr:PilT/PilU family type 4a pilus ATPase [Lachnospiraceae bacterium]
MADFEEREEINEEVRAKQEAKLEGLIEILREAKIRNASDIHLAPASPVLFRIDGELVPLPDRYFKPYEIDSMLDTMLSSNQMKELKERGELDFAYSITGFSRIRINVFRQRNTYAMSLRLLLVDIPDPTELGLPKPVVDLTNLSKGLVLVTGSVSTGKSTTIAALIEQIANTYTKSIITVEDPIEYLLKHGRSMVLQREIGTDTKSYHAALEAALRQDSDVIFVGELQDMETIQMAILAAETGHLVISSLHTNNTVDSLYRLIEVFPPHQQQQIRVQLSMVLECIITQQLMPRMNSEGRVAAFEIMLKNSTIQEAIKGNKIQQIPQLMQRFQGAGMSLMDDAIYELYMRSRISAETAVKYAYDRSLMEQKVKLF